MFWSINSALKQSTREVMSTGELDLQGMTLGQGLSMSLILHAMTVHQSNLIKSNQICLKQSIVSAQQDMVVGDYLTTVNV